MELQCVKLIVERSADPLVAPREQLCRKTAWFLVKGYSFCGFHVKDIMEKERQAIEMLQGPVFTGSEKEREVNTLPLHENERNKVL